MTTPHYHYILMNLVSETILEGRASLSRVHLGSGSNRYACLSLWRRERHLLLTLCIDQNECIFEQKQHRSFLVALRK